MHVISPGNLKGENSTVKCSKNDGKGREREREYERKRKGMKENERELRELL